MSEFVVSLTACVTDESQKSMLILPVTELTSTAKKIMEVFRYFRIKKEEYLSIKLLLCKRHLWRDIEEEEFNQAVEELIELRYIRKLEDPEGWALTDAGDEYIKRLGRY